MTDLIETLEHKIASIEEIADFLNATANNAGGQKENKALRCATANLFQAMGEIQEAAEIIREREAGESEIKVIEKLM